MFDHENRCVETMQDDPSESSVIWADIAYHLDLSVHLAATGETNEAASETALALALLSAEVDLGTMGPRSDLPAQAAVAPDGAATKTIYARANALAMEIQAHYVSEGRHRLADAYGQAATSLRVTAESDRG